jgi:CubicO group peptidase (beta-lactamase class C family)
MKRNLFASALTLLMLFISALCLDAQNTKYPAGIEEKIRLVENNLGDWVRTQNDVPWNLEQRMKLHNINGVSIAVVHDSKIEWARGYGWADVSEKRPVTEKTLFQAASISKSLNGVGVMKLVQDKKIDLNTDINQYLTSWKFPYDTVSKNKPITPAALLSHTAGLTIHGFPGYSIGDSIPTLQQILDGQKPANTEAVRSFGEPGASVIYSGGGVMISQLIVTDVTHQPYDEFMQMNVLNPMDMKSSFFTQPPEKSKSKLLATGYRADGKEIEGKYHIYPEQAAAGLWTNPVDLCKYIIETVSSWNGQSDKVLTPEFTRLRLAPVLQNAAAGVFVSKKDSSLYFAHGGANEGFTCYYVGDVIRGNGMVIMTNSDNGALSEEVANSVATVYGWKDYYQPVLKTVVEVDKAILDTYVGKYEAEDNVTNIRRKGRNLLISPYPGFWATAYFTSDVDFFVREFEGDLRFITDAEGKVTGFNMNGMTVRKVE